MRAINVSLLLNVETLLVEEKTGSRRCAQA